MSIVWLRHGETDLNARRVVQPADTPLSARGRAQAAAAGLHLQAWRPAALLSSDLPRARQTADAVAQATGLPVVTEPLLRERNFGVLRGRPWDSLGFEVSSLREAPEGGESMEQFHVRAALAWQRVVAHRAALDGPLVVVSHGLLIHDVLLRHAQWPAGPSLPARLANASLSVVGAKAPHPVWSVDATGHLPDVAADPA